MNLEIVGVPWAGGRGISALEALILRKEYKQISERLCPEVVGGL